MIETNTGSLRVPRPEACLIVEDDKQLAAFIAAEVEAAGFKAVTATSLSEAVIALGLNNFVKAVVDWKLGGSDSGTLLETLEAGGKIDYAVFTGYADEARARVPAGVPVLEKASGLGELRKWLRQRRAP